MIKIRIENLPTTKIFYSYLSQLLIKNHMTDKPEEQHNKCVPSPILCQKNFTEPYVVFEKIGKDSS